ncbi:hypothetical protein D1114_07095 [Cereibacter sphaeroides]|uniref:Uncharacterized protein n=1 Tax=Cereibacter sphaeroides TaxID=1063 RepID=A0AAX1UN91_CERSP|nr:hypothetical protein [Cereibacter sphaeroides]RHZ96470.1 hypothetical protein D1114_07095 [Cereibacter sphaeroides]
MTKSTYMDRAMRARDPRYARILERLGYARRDMVPAAPADPVTQEAGDDISALRAAYQEKFGKRPFMGWDAETLRDKLSGKADD